MSIKRMAAAAVLLVLPVVVFAQRPLSLGTVAPANSLWDKALKRMATDVQQATNRRVRFRVASNSQGNEAAIVRRLLLGTTQAGALTQIGLSDLSESFSVLGMPFFFASDAEAKHVLDALTPTFSRELLQQGLVLINWGHGGWAHLFSVDPIRTLADLKHAKLFTSAGDDQMVRWYRQNGFDPVPLEVSDVPVGLNTGLITVYPFPPYAAMLMQYYRAAPNMLDLPLGPVVAATVIHKKAWDGLDAADQAAIRSAGEVVERHLFQDVPVQDQEAIDEMRKRGLSVTTLDAAAVEEFRREADTLTASMRGTIVPAAIYDEAVRARDAFRRQ